MELSTVAGVPENFLLTMAPLAFHSLMQKKHGSELQHLQLTPVSECRFMCESVFG